MILGFSGTQAGMSSDQIKWLKKYVYLSRPTIFHHGCCIGADYQAHKIIRELIPRCVIVGHPPTNSSKEAKGLDYDILKGPKPYLERNQDIVNECEIFVGMPKTDYEQLRSGSWSTIRRARIKFRHEPNSVFVIAP